MKTIINNKIVLPVVALAIVGIAGTVFTLSHSGPTTVQAQSPSVQSVNQEKETNDDATISAPSKVVVAPSVSKKADTQNDTEIQDGN